MPKTVWTEVAPGEAAASWDRDLQTLDDWTLDQSHAWGEHSQRLGWQIRRFLSRTAEGRPRAMMQVLHRSPAPGVHMLWSPGGPVGDVSAWGAGLRRTLTQSFRGVGHYVRFFSHRPVREQDAATLERLDWRRVRTKVRSGLSMRLDLSRGMGELAKGLSANWRHNLKRAGKRGLTVRPWSEPDLDEILAVYRSMEQHKDLREQFSREQLASLRASFGDRLVTWRCDGAEGRLLALRACVVIGDRAWDMLAATTVEGRRVYASYAACWALFEECRARGVRAYDLRGVEPDRGPGVYDFKRGTGAALVEYLGEWEWASNDLMRMGADWVVSHQRSGDQAGHRSHAA